MLGVPIGEVHETVPAAFGSAYVNDFIQNGRVKRVFVQAHAPYRMQPKDLDRLYVRNRAGTMTPFSAFTSGSLDYGSPQLERFNAFPYMNIVGQAPQGRSSGEAMEEIVSKLAEGIDFDWSGKAWVSSRPPWKAPNCGCGPSS